MKPFAWLCGQGVSVRTRKALRASGVALVVLLLSSPLFSQLNTGRISGAITDQSGGAIAGATVSVIDTARGQTRTLTADNSGLYAAPNLLPGTYTVRVEFMGFQTIERQNVQVDAGSDIRVDVTMQPGQQTQTVTVTEALPVVNTTNAQTGGTLENNQIAELPFNGRNYRWTVEYVPGIMTQPGEGTASSMTNGGGSDWVNFMVDGLYDQSPYSKQSSVGGAGEAGDTTILPLDAVQEIAVVQNPKAEYGWDPGTTINVALKSGTNDIHGSAFAFGRDTDFDAKNNFAAVRAPTSYEQFGGSFGGPLKKDKLFYFVGEESIRLNVASDFLLNNDVPSQNDTVTSTSLGIPAAIAADNVAGVPLSQLSLNMLGCGSAASYAGKTTPAAVGSCTVNSQGFGSLYSDSPDCTLSGAASNSASCSFPQYGGSNNVIGKIDYHINDHHSFSGSYFFGQYHEYAAASTTITQPYWEEVLGVRSQMVRGVEIWTPNSSWLNELRAGWDHDSRPIEAADCSPNGSVTNPLGTNAQPGQDGSPNYLTAYGLQSGTGICGNPTIKLSKLATLGFGNNRDNFESDFQGSDSASYTRGTHQFKFGVDARFESFNGVKVQDSQRGTVTFGGAGAAAFSGATALEDFIAGDPSSETIKLGTPIRTVRWDLIALFVQDDWRILQRLTLNLGLRWEDETPAKDDNGQLANFDPAAPSGMVQNNQLWNNQSDFSPHFGLAWDVTGKGTTTVRSGIGFAYGIPQLMDNITSQFEDQSGLPTAATLLYGNGTAEQTYGVNTVGNITNMLIAPAAGTAGGVITPTGHLPWAANSNLFNASAFQCGDGLPVYGGSGTNPATCTGYGVGSNYKLPQMITWNLNIEHAFSNTLSLDIGYVGSHTSDISEILDLNEPNLSLLPGQVTIANSFTSEQERRPYFENCTTAQVGTGGLGLNPNECFPWFAQILSMQSIGSANYAGLQAYLNQRPTHNFTYTIGYTLGHALGLQDGVGTGTNFVLNDLQPKGEYGNMNLDVLHHFSFTGSYQIPGRKAPGQMLEGWAINSTVNILSPLPLNADDTTDDFSATGEDIDRWTLYGPATPFDKIIGGAGLIPCYGVSGSTFAKQANCITVASASSFPQPCISAATNEPTGPTGQTGLQELSAVGCYSVGGSAMVAPALGTYGNMLRNQLRGKGFSTWNASVTKDWKIKERLNMQFRAEGFNILNRTMYAGVGLNLGAPNTFGEATSTPDVAKANPIVGSGGPREVQLGLKFTF